jgi:hypothetical protein
MGMSDAKVANHTHRTADAVEKLVTEQQRTNQLLEQLLAAATQQQPAQQQR